MTFRIVIALSALLAAACTKSKTANERAEAEREARDRGAAEMEHDARKKETEKKKEGEEDGCAHVRNPSAEDLPVELPDFGSGVIFQTFGSDREGALSGFRIFEDGRYERKKPDEPWRAMKPLSKESMEEFREAIAAADLPSLAGFHHPDQPPDDATIGIVQTGAGPDHAIVNDQSCPMPALDDLFERIAHLILQ